MKKMTKPLIQIDDEVREMNDDELAQHQSMLADEIARAAQAQAKANAKAVLLERLGITADEATLLLQ
jgi:hypothetical protein